jgi:hypothetical protein
MIMARPKKRDDNPIEFPPSLFAIIALDPMAKKHQVLDTSLRLWASPLYGQRKFWVPILISVWFYTFGTIIWLLHSCPDFMASNDEFALNLRYLLENDGIESHEEIFGFALSSDLAHE